MVKIGKETLYQWISENDAVKGTDGNMAVIQGCIIAMVNEDIVKVNGKDKIEHTLYFDLANGQRRRMSLYGVSMANLVKAYGDDTEVWHGKKFSIMLEKVDKGMRKMVIV